MKAGRRVWAIEEGWGWLSDLAAIGVKVQLREERKLTLRQRGWKKVREYVDREKEKREAGVRGSEHQ